METKEIPEQFRQFYENMKAGIRYAFRYQFGDWSWSGYYSIALDGTMTAIEDDTIEEDFAYALYSGNIDGIEETYWHPNTLDDYTIYRHRGYTGAVEHPKEPKW